MVKKKTRMVVQDEYSTFVHTHPGVPESPLVRVPLPRNANVSEKTLRVLSKALMFRSTFSSILCQVAMGPSGS
jgi:hypothetical protein